MSQITSTQQDLDRMLLFEASRPGATAGRLREILSMGADPKARDAIGQDALMRACARGDRHAGPLVRALIPSSDLSATGYRGMCATAIAVRCGSISALVELVAADAPMPLDVDGSHPADHAKTPEMKSLMEAAALRLATKGAASAPPSHERQRL